MTLRAPAVTIGLSSARATCGLDIGGVEAVILDMLRADLNFFPSFRALSAGDSYRRFIVWYGRKARRRSRMLCLSDLLPDR